MYKFLFLFLLLVSISSISAQSIIQGEIIDKKTGEKIIGVEIMLQPIKKGCVSDENGKYSLAGIKAGKYTLIAIHVGYHEIKKEILVEQNKNLIVNLEMETHVRELLAVEIRDDKIKNHAYSKVVLKESQIEQHPVRDIGDYLRKVPNITAVRKGGANLDPVIRGFKFDQLNIQLDNGLMMEGGCPNRMDPTTSHVEAGDIEAIEVLKGPFALRYGPVMGGVVNLLTASPRPFDKFQIHAKANFGYESNWNGQRQHLTVYGGGKKIFFTMSANNALYGNYTDGNGDLVKSSFEKFGYNAKLGIALAENHVVTLSYSEFYARNVDFPALPMDERADDTKLYSLDYKANSVSKTIESIYIKAYYTDIDHTMDNKARGFSDTVVAVSQLFAKRMGFRTEFGLKVGKNDHLFVGADMFRIEKDGDRVKNMIGQYPNNGMVPFRIENLWNEAVINNFGLFGEYRINKNMWESVFSARVDLNSAYSDSISLMKGPVDIIGTPADSTESDFVNFSFSAGLTRKLNEDMSLGISIGRGVRSASMVERFIICLPVGFDNYEYLGNPELKPEANNEVDIIYKYNNQKYGGLEFTLFYSLIQDYISGVYLPPSVQKPLTQGVKGVKEFENIGTANVYGFELSYATPDYYKWRLSVTAAYTAGTVHEAEVLKYDEGGVSIGTEIIKNDPMGEIPPLDLKANLSYEFFNKILVPTISYRFVATQDRISKSLEELSSPSYSLLDFSLYYKYNESLSVVGGINNVFDNAYFEHLNRRVLGTNTRIYEPGRVFYFNLIFSI